MEVDDLEFELRIFDRPSYLTVGKDWTVPRLIICGEAEADCECVLAPDHPGPHECSEDCGGAWEYDDRGRFHIVRLPLIGREAQTALLGDEW